MPVLFLIVLAAVFYASFKYTDIYQHLDISTTIKVLMWLAIGVFVLWFAVRVYAASIPGGGPGYVVSYYARYTAVPAIALLLLLDIIVIFKSFGSKAGLTVSAIVLTAATIRTATPYVERFSHQAKWEEYCETAADEFNLSGEYIEKLEFYYFIANGLFTRQEDGQFKRTRSEYFGPALLKRGVIQEYEAVTKGNPSHYHVVLENGKEVKTPIDETAATHRISSYTEKYTEGQGGMRWVERQVITIRNIESGKVIAKRIQFNDSFTGNRSCAPIYNNQISAADFIEKAILSSRNVNQSN